MTSEAAGWLAALILVAVAVCQAALAAPGGT